MDSVRVGPAAIAACTIVSPNYLPFARVFALSYRAQHPGHEIYVLVVGREIDKRKFADEPFTAVSLEEIGVENLQCVGMKYGILELNTNVKPQFMLFLLNKGFIGTLIYLDPDIYVYSELEPVLAKLEHGNIILTPHLTTSAADSDWSIEQEVLFNGSYNLGFIAVNEGTETRRMLQWWNRRCIDGGFSEGRSGLFVDQKWMNLAPSLFEGVVICKDLGCNMAVWNLGERKASRRDGRYWVNEATPLCFFHFSGVSLDRNDALFRDPRRPKPDSRSDLVPLFSDYRTAVNDNRRPVLDQLPYGFSHFDDGSVVTQLARRIYAAHEEMFRDEDPFSRRSSFYRFAQSRGLLGGRNMERKIGWHEFQAGDGRVLWIHRILRMALRVLGPTKYELLMRYLSHIAILRNQGVFIK